jgi:putative transposase
LAGLISLTTKIFPLLKLSLYRILAEHAEVRERRHQLRHPNYSKPELLATGANQLWSWDITKLHGPYKWQHSGQF